MIHVLHLVESNRLHIVCRRNKLFSKSYMCFKLDLHSAVSQPLLNAYFTAFGFLSQFQGKLSLLLSSLVFMSHPSGSHSLPLCPFYHSAVLGRRETERRSGGEEETHWEEIG